MLKRMRRPDVMMTLKKTLTRRLSRNFHYVVPLMIMTIFFGLIFLSVDIESTHYESPYDVTRGRRYGLLHPVEGAVHSELKYPSPNATWSTHVLSQYSARNHLTSVANTTNSHLWPIPSDVRALKSLFSDWPADKPRAVIHYLTTSRRLTQLRFSLESVDKNFNDIYQYPIVIFHESDLRPHLSYIRSLTRSRVFFQEVTFALPDFLPIKAVPQRPRCPSSVGYRHMCRFHARTIYDYEIMHDLHYAWRLDDDSLILRPIRYDLFRYMRDSDLIYGYIDICADNIHCVRGLWEATSAYVRDHHIKPQFFYNWTHPTIYYNNFEISNMGLWTSDEYQAYIDYVDRLGGIYYHRWGDAPIKSLAVSLFVPKNQTHLFTDVAYMHQAFRNI